MNVEDKGCRILIIEDEPQMQKLLKVALGPHGYSTRVVSGGKEGIEETAIHRPDLIILDLSLPDMDGIEVLTILREWSQVPVLVLSARDREADKIAALDNGADDYVTKPFNMGELLARIRVALRHASKSGDEVVLHFNELTIDLSRRLVTRNGEEIKLTPTEYDILKLLATNAGKVLTHRQLLRTIWGPSYENENHYLRVYIGQLRQKVEVNPSQPVHFITEPGVGYRFL